MTEPPEFAECTICGRPYEVEDGVDELGMSKDWMPYCSEECDAEDHRGE